MDRCTKCGLMSCLCLPVGEFPLSCQRCGEKVWLESLEDMPIGWVEVIDTEGPSQFFCSEKCSVSNLKQMGYGDVHEAPINIHNHAMVLLDKARSFMRDGDKESEDAYRKAASKKASWAAMCLFENIEREPERSKLFESAACLWLRIGDWRMSEKMAAAGLLGDIPDEKAESFRSVLEECKKARLEVGSPSRVIKLFEAIEKDD